MQLKCRFYPIFSPSNLCYYWNLIDATISALTILGYLTKNNTIKCHTGFQTAKLFYSLT